MSFVIYIKRMRILAVTGSKQDNFFLFYFFFLELLLVWIRVRVRLVLVVFPRSRLCLRENDNRVLFERVH